MTELFRNKYRIPSNRLCGWNYSNNGHYFITIVTAGRNMLFGNIKNGEMILNDLGLIVYDEFFRSFEIRDELFLGEFVLMPNHLHTIVILDKSHCSDVDLNTDTIETHGRASLQTQFQRQPKSISSFVAGFKSSTINRIDDWIEQNNVAMAKFNNNNPLWQTNYHDHIIRNAAEYQNISKYIVCNPLNWEEDSLNEHLE
jgi:REP element-mobilizing transposase RayT